VRRLGEVRARRMPGGTGDAEPPLQAAHSDDVRIAIRLLEHALERAAADPRLGTVVAETDPDAAGVTRVDVGHGGRWFEVDRGPRVDLAGRAVPSAVLWALCERSLDPDARPMTTRELVAAAWPGQRMRPRSGANRLYVVLAELRKLGLRDVIRSGPSGYSLRCELHVAF
jgi:hypothetical protein